MAEQHGINLKLRAAFLFPTLLIIVVLAIIDAFITDISYLMGSLIPLVFFTAVIALMLTERRIRRHNSK